MKGGRRSRTVRLTVLTNRERALAAIEAGPTDHARPATRAECVAGFRPCPFVGCKWNLYLDVMPTGNVKLNFPDLEPDGLVETCVLDVADEGPQTLERIAVLLNMTRERARQLEHLALRKLRLPIAREALA